MQTSHPKVSVVIASFNRAELLREALQSVAEQTYQDFELVIVDDGSTDHCLEVIEEYRLRFPEKVRVYFHDMHANHGIVTTYQMCFSKARGELIAFLEHDDLWSENYLEEKVRVLSDYPDVGVVFSPYKVLGNGWFGRDMALRQILLRTQFRKNRPFDNFSNLLQCNNVATFSCFMTRKALLDDVPPPQNEILALDWWILLHLSLVARFYCEDASYTHWRWSRESAIGRQTFEEHRDMGCEFMERMYAETMLESANFTSEQKTTFNKYAENFRLFHSYYLGPSLTRFFSFFMRDPLWAMASTASLAINHLKFRQARND